MIVDGIGELRPHGDWWILQYVACGHEQWFMRGPMNYERAALEREVREYHAECSKCHPPPPVWPWLPDPSSYYAEPGTGLA